MPTWFIWLVQPTRRHSALGDLNPNDFERAAAKETSRAVRNAHRPARGVPGASRSGEREGKTYPPGGPHLPVLGKTLRPPAFAHRRAGGGSHKLSTKRGYSILHDGRVEIDSNFVENRIRPVKLTARNALFAGHDEGATAWGCIASLLETCKMNAVEPYAWLKSTLEKIAAGHPQSRIHELLPWAFDQASN